MNLWSIYHSDIPTFIQRIAQTQSMQRLQQVGMNCGCEYTSFPLFKQMESYSRYDHSVGAGLIVWHFTHDIRQSVAALLHDVATPAFAHVVDFLHHDYEKQESTEDATLEIIQSDPDLLAVLADLSLTAKDVSDYHLFPIADNDTPRLSSDRLEYSLGNIVNYGFASQEVVKEIYHDLCVGTNEEGIPEIMFQNQNIASLFAKLSLCCSKVYVSDADRFAMQMLAELLKEAIECNLIQEEDLMLTEPEIIAKLTTDLQFTHKWKQFRGYHSMIVGADVPGARRITAKKRHIDPYVLNVGRVTGYDETYKNDLQAFLAYSFDYPVFAQTH